MKISKNIGKKITIYEREYCEKWPRMKDTKSVYCKLYKRYFIPNGDAILIKGKQKILKNWLKTRKPQIPDRTVFILTGRLFGDRLEDIGVQVDSRDKMLASSKVMNTEAFIRVK